MASISSSTSHFPAALSVSEYVQPFKRAGLDSVGTFQPRRSVGRDPDGAELDPRCAAGDGTGAPPTAAHILAALALMF